MRIGIIGTGKVGGTLGTALADAGHQVRLGSRHPRQSASGPQITDLTSALVDAEVVLLAAAAPTVRSARAFNTLGWENFAEPVFDGVPADLFFSCQPDDRAVLEELIGAVGLHPAYGGAEMQNAVDGVLPRWCALVQQHGGSRHLALRVLRGSVPPGAE